MDVILRDVFCIKNIEKNPKTISISQALSGGH